MPRLKKYKILVLFLWLIQSAFAQYPQHDFINPMAGDMQIIGTFCELRPNHFHGGLDIRTDGEIGKPIYAVADGYISRINISTYGYGKALYITHPNGYTSVYAHLSEFPKELQWYIKSNQVLQKRFDIELYPEPELLQVKQGQLIAYSGNTGGSQGPHLHFEIRETKSEAPVNPLLFGLKMSDNLPPAVLNMYVYSRDTTAKHWKGQYPSKNLPMFYTIRTGKKKKKKVLVPITEYQLPYGTYALGVNLRDYATSLGDNNGVNYIQLYRDDSLVYDCRLEQFRFDQMRMHNCYIDFNRQKESGIKMHKLFKDEGNTLSFCKHSPCDGWFNIEDTLRHRFTIVAWDAYGNTTRKQFSIQGNPAAEAVHSDYWINKKAVYCKADKENLIKVSPAINVTIPAHVLYDDYWLDAYTTGALRVTIGNDNVPLDKKIKLSFKLNKEWPDYLVEKLVVTGTGKTYGTTYKDGWLTAEVKEFGTYYVALDSTRPYIKPVIINKNSYFCFVISDKLSGIKSFDLYVNDVWYVLDYESKASRIFGRIPVTLGSGTHTIRLVVTDERNNFRTYTKNITIP